jgi:hypothetical protein
MTKLFCKVGDLAITVRAEVPENLGRIVHIVRPLGAQPWSDFGEVHLWWAEVLPGSLSQLHYLQLNGALEQKSQGPVPDLFLRPITPPEGLTAVADWLQIQCARPADIAQGVAMYCDYQNALRGARDAN